MNRNRCVVVLALVACCAGAAVTEAQVELVVWHGYRGEEKAAFEKVCETYSERTEGVSIKTLAVPYDAYADKISAAVPRGKGPDVFIFAQDRLGGWVESGKTIESLDFFLDDEIIERFVPSTMDAMTYQGTIWGLPLNYKVMTLIYNKDLISSPPKTTGELVKVGKQLTDADVGNFGLAYWYSNFYYHAPVMNAFGGGVFGADGKPILDNDANVKSLELLMTWVDQGFVPLEPSTALVTSLFNNRKAAMVFSGPWQLGEVDPAINVGLAMLPTVDEAGGKPMRPWMTVEGVYVAEPSAHTDEAFDFVVYLTDVEASTVLALEGRQTVANLAVYDDPRVVKDEILQAFKNQVEVAVPMPNVPEMTMMWSPMTTAMNGIVRRSASPKAALDQAQDEVKERIEKLHKQ